MRTTFGLLFLVLSLVGCGGPSAGGRNLGGPPRSVSFPALRQDGPIQLQASIKEKHAQMLRVDLLRQMRILPVWVEVSIDRRATSTELEGMGSIQVSADRLGLMLYLQDGAALSAMSTAKLIESSRLSAQSKQRIRQEQLDSGFVEPGKRVDGFVFFQLPNNSEYILQGNMTVAHTSGGFTKTLDLYRSLISLQLDDGERRTVYLGLDR